MNTRLLLAVNADSLRNRDGGARFGLPVGVVDLDRQRPNR